MVSSARARDPRAADEWRRAQAWGMWVACVLVVVVTLLLDVDFHVELDGLHVEEIHCDGTAGVESRPAGGA